MLRYFYYNICCEDPLSLPSPVPSFLGFPLFEILSLSLFFLSFLRSFQTFIVIVVPLKLTLKLDNWVLIAFNRPFFQFVFLFHSFSLSLSLSLSPSHTFSLSHFLYHSLSLTRAFSISLLKIFPSLLSVLFSISKFRMPVDVSPRIIFCLLI